MSTQETVRWDLIAAALLRKVSPTAVEDFLSSPEYAGLPEEAREALAVADAEIEFAEAQERQKARQEEAERERRETPGRG